MSVTTGSITVVCTSFDLLRVRPAVLGCLTLTTIALSIFASGRRVGASGGTGRVSDHAHRSPSGRGELAGSELVDIVDGVGEARDWGRRRRGDESGADRGGDDRESKNGAAHLERESGVEGIDWTCEKKIRKEW